MKIINVSFYILFLGMSFPLLAMEEVQVSPQKALASPKSPVSPRRKDNGSVVAVRNDDKKISRQLSFSSSSQEEEEEKKEQGIARFLSSKDNLPYVMRDAYKNTELNNYATQAFVFSEQGVIDAMNDAVSRGAEVDLSVGAHYQNKMDQYNVTAVRRDKNMHGKNIAGLDISPSKGEPKKALFITGSANPTNSIWPRGNAEMVVEVVGDVELTKKAYQLMKSKSPVKKKKDIVQDTPKKRDVYSSQKTALNKSRAQRVLTVANQIGDDRIVWASTMNINDKDMADALSKAALSGADTRLIVHKTALTKDSIPLLQGMVDDGVKVNVRYPAKDSRIINHGKGVITNKIVTMGNANFTDLGDEQMNLETLFPNDLLLIADAKTDYKRTEKECIPFKKALELSVVDKKTAAEKKKEAADAKKKEAKEKKSPTKKRKKISGRSAPKRPATKKQKK